ncbi:MAG: glycosyltransferase family A protein [Planctomycetota bacterium]
MTPAISILLPVYNGQQYLRESLASLSAQTLPPAEIVVIDDGSTDQSAAIAADFPGVTLIQQANAGAAAARNAGLTAATGNLIACLDADDLADPKRLELQAAAFDRDPDLDGCFTHLAEFLSPELPDDERAQLECKAEAAPGACIGTLMIRRDSFLRVGLLDPELRVAYFLQWYGLAQDQGLRFEMLSETLVQRRLHLDNTGRREKGRLAKEYAKVLAAKIARRRSQK